MIRKCECGESLMLRIKEPAKFRNNKGRWYYGVCTGFVAGGDIDDCEDNNGEDKIFLCRARNAYGELSFEARYSECVNV